MSKDYRTWLDSGYDKNLIDGHAVQTPWNVVKMVVDRMMTVNGVRYKKFKKAPAVQVAVFHNLEFLVELKERGFDMSKITFFENFVKAPFKKKIAKSFGVNCVDIKINSDDMKFDYIIGNPPYGNKSNKGLVMKFINLAASLTEGETPKIWFVIPYSDKGRKANKFIEDRKHYQGECVSHFFKVGLDNIRIVGLSPETVRDWKRPKIDTYGSYQNPYQNRKTIGDMMGENLFYGIDGDTSNGRINSSQTMYQGRRNTATEILVKPKRNGNWWKELSSEIYSQKSSEDVSTKMLNNWCLCIERTASSGKINSTIIQNTMASSGCYVMVFETIDEAKKLENWLKTDSIVTEISKLQSLRMANDGGMVAGIFSIAMLKLLPWYE